MDPADTTSLNCFPTDLRQSQVTTSCWTDSKYSLDQRYLATRSVNTQRDLHLQEVFEPSAHAAVKFTSGSRQGDSP